MSCIHVNSPICLLHSQKVTVYLQSVAKEARPLPLLVHEVALREPPVVVALLGERPLQRDLLEQEHYEPGRLLERKKKIV